MPDPKEVKQPDTPTEKPTQQSETISLTTTPDDLKKLRHEIQEGKIPDDPEKYNHEITKLGDKDTLKSILEKVFSQNKSKVPKGTLLRIEFALTAKGIDLATLKKSRNVDSWKVEKGTMYFLAPDKKMDKKTEVVAFDILPWMELKRSVEVVDVNRKTYELGDYDGGDDISDKNTISIEAGVDATKHGEKLRTEAWYKAKSEAAKTLLKVYTGRRLDSPTMNFLAADNRVQKLQDLANQTEFTPSKFHANFVKKFVAANGKDDLYGREGLYNLVLAFQRAMDAHRGTDLGESKIEIGLRIGTSIKEKDERYAKTSNVKLGTAPGETLDKKDTTPKTKTPPDTGVGIPGIALPQKPKAKSKTSIPGLTVKPGGLHPRAAELNENTPVEVASRILIESYTEIGFKSFMDAMKKLGREKGPKVLIQVLEQLKKENPEQVAKLIQDLLTKGPEGESAALLKKRFDEAMDKAIEAETNPHQKKFLELVKQINSLTYAAEAPNSDQRKVDEGKSNTMRDVIKKIGEIDASKLPAESREFLKGLTGNMEDHMRQNMALDMLETTQNGLEASFLDRTAEDTTFANSLQELRDMGPSKAAEGLRNEWTSGEFLDQDAEIYLASMHVMAAIQAYLTYEYPQLIAKGEKIPNPIKWALEKVKSGAKIKIPEGAPDGSIHDVYSNGPLAIKAGTTFDVDQIFIDKTEELRLFDEYQKGEERVGAASFWNAFANWQGTLATIGGGVGILGGPLVSASGASVGGAIGYGLDRILPTTGIGDELAESRAAFMSTKDGLLLANKEGLINESDNIFKGGLKDFMSENGKLGKIEQIEMAKILYLVHLKKYDEARTQCARILSDKLKEPTKDQLRIRKEQIEEDEGKQLRAQIELMLQNEPELAGKNITETKKYQEIVDAVIEERAYITLLGDQVENVDKSKLTDFEKEIYEIWDGIGAEYSGWKEEHTDIVKGGAKFVVELLLIEWATAGAGSVVAGAVGVERAAMIGARGLNLVRGTEIAAGGLRIGKTIGSTRIGTYVFRNRVIGRAGKWVAEGKTLPARAAGNFLHAVPITQGLHMMHGSTLDPIGSPGQTLYEVGTTAFMLQVLGWTQGFSRGTIGKLPGVGKAAEKVASKIPGVRRIPGVKRVDEAIQLPARGTNWLLKKLPTSPGRVPDIRNIPEMALELFILHKVQNAEKWARVQTGQITETELAAMTGPEWESWLQSAVIVGGLRAWGGATAQRRSAPQPQPQIRQVLRPPRSGYQRVFPERGTPTRGRPYQAPHRIAPSGRAGGLSTRLQSGNVPKRYPKSSQDSTIASEYWNKVPSIQRNALKTSKIDMVKDAITNGNRRLEYDVTGEAILKGELSAVREIAKAEGHEIGAFTVKEISPGVYQARASLKPIP